MSPGEGGGDTKPLRGRRCVQVQWENRTRDPFPSLSFNRKPRSRNLTVLGELGGAEEAGDPEGLLGPLQGLVVGREVVLGEGQLQVAGAVGQAGVLLTLAEEKHTLVIPGLSREAVTDSWGG